MSTIPASQLVSVTPSVLAAGGTGIDVIGLILTNSTRVPIGAVPAFPDADSVGEYFGDGSQEAALAGVYFSGFNNASKIPGSVLFAQYNEAAVAAYMRGGALGLTLAQLQALTGSLTVVVDGDSRTDASIILSGATSFSDAATQIQTELNAAIATEATFTGSVGAVYTAAIAGTVMTVSALTEGVIRVGDTISGTGVTAGTTITSLGTGTGGTGTYNVSVSQTVGSTTITSVNNVLNVTILGTGTLAVGQTVTGGGLAANTKITALGTGSGGTGTYILSGAQQQSASGAKTATSTAVAVIYDSQSDAFVLTSGITGAISTVAFATGTLAAGLKWTSATGAVLSQGAAAATPAAFMAGIIDVTMNWVTFMTAFDPDGGSGTDVREAFAAWKDTQNDRFAYVVWDTDVGPTASSPDVDSLGRLLAAANDSGSCVVWAADATSGALLAAFVCGAAAAIDFTERNGRMTFAYKAQAGLVAGVTTALAASNLRANGYNFYGAYGAANENFVWFQNSQCTGDFAWLDAYIDQIWLNNQLQLALLLLLQNARSIPYSAAGTALIQAALADPINAGLNFGAFSPGAISSAQVAQVNADAGSDIANTLQTQGWFLQVLAASAAVRAARGSPPCTFWYLDRGSIQQINLNSVAVQ